MSTRVRDRGQVTIPKEIRELAGVSSGDEVDWRVVDGEIIAKKRSYKDAFEKWMGKGRPLGVSVDEFAEEMRGR